MDTLKIISKIRMRVIVGQKIILLNIVSWCMRTMVPKKVLTNPDGYFVCSLSSCYSYCNKTNKHHLSNREISIEFYDSC